MQEQIPTINLADFLTGGVTAIDQQALAVACEDHGFFLLAGHGHDALVNEVFAQAQSFLANLQRLSAVFTETKVTRWVITTVNSPSNDEI